MISPNCRENFLLADLAASIHVANRSRLLRLIPMTSNARSRMSSSQMGGLAGTCSGLSLQPCLHQSDFVLKL